jgi:catechol 2,3-dioxygenase-like lactoylglutathione lyase family enzyme
VAFVGVTDLDRAAAFYGGTLGLTLRDESPLALVAETGDMMVRITATDAVRPAPYTVLGWRVDDIAAAVEALRGRGVTFARYPGLNQDDDGVWLAPGGARVAWFQDPDGNVLSLTQDA